MHKRLLAKAKEYYTKFFKSYSSFSSIGERFGLRIENTENGPFEAVLDLDSRVRLGRKLKREEYALKPEDYLLPK